jgi:Fe-S cluster assembly scaffold protein SufB
MTTGLPEQLEALAAAYEASGGHAASLFDGSSASLSVSGNAVIGSNEIPGVHIEGAAVPNGVRVAFVAHCTFPNALRVRHVMNARMHIGKGAEMTYSETHFHGDRGGAEVLPALKVFLDEGGILKNEFRLTRGTVGRLQADYEAELCRDAVCEFYAKVYGKMEDRIVVRESIFLNGENARGLAKSRIVSSDRCQSEVIGEVVGNAPFSRGHIDCVEILKGAHARASAVPRLVVVDDRAKLTHEAAIGSVDKKQVETLMARGLGEDEAVDVVVRGMLR